MNRRTFCRSAVALVAAGGLATGLSAGQLDENQPDHVTIDYNEDWLRTYRPGLKAKYETWQASDAVYAARFTSEEHPTDVGYYWHRLSHQDGAGLVGVDSHLYDHEPVIVEVADDGSVASVTYSYYHHFADSVTNGPLDDILVANATTNPTHVTLEISPEWHNYQAAPEATVDDLTLDYPLADWTTAYDTWTDQAVYEATADNALFNPWAFRSEHVADPRDSWWDESTTDYRAARLWHDLTRRLDILDMGGPTATYP